MWAERTERETGRSVCRSVALRLWTGPYVEAFTTVSSIIVLHQPQPSRKDSDSAFMLSLMCTLSYDCVAHSRIADVQTQITSNCDAVRACRAFRNQKLGSTIIINDALIINTCCMTPIVAQVKLEIRTMKLETK